MNMPRSHETTGLINRENAVQIGAGALEANDGPDANGLVSGGLNRTHRWGGNAGIVSHDDEDETVDVPPMSDAQLLGAYRLLGDMQRVMDVLTTNDDEEETDGA